MMWQPTWSACTTLRISRGEAQISSERGASTMMSTARAMIGIGSMPASAIAPGEHGDVRRRSVLDRRGDQLDLRGGEQRRDVDLHAALGELAHERRHRLAEVVETGILT